jgi:hypothetical protein
MSEDQLDKCREILKKNYRYLYYYFPNNFFRKETYKYYAAIGRTENLFAINKLTLTNLLAHKIGLLDAEKLAEADLLFTFIKKKPKKGKNHPKTGVIRFEFIEIIWRLALMKFFETGSTNTESEALENIFKSFVIPTCHQYNSQTFRETHKWDEKCANVFQAHAALFEHVYHSWSGTHRIGTDRSSLSYGDFLNAFTQAGLLNDMLAEREIILSYAQSMATQVNEIENDSHLKMQIMEFYEAVARAAEYISLPPPGSSVRTLLSYLVV